MNNQSCWNLSRWSVQVHPTSAYNPHKSVVQYTTDSSRLEYVQEGHFAHGGPAAVEMENDEIIAHVLQEELSRATDTDAGVSTGAAGESGFDAEVGKRIHQTNELPHVPTIDRPTPFADEATSDRQRMLNRLELYDLDELKILGDGNCQFRSLSDQLYRSPEYHKSVRQHIVDQLKAHPELYSPYIPMSYHEYLMKISKLREWGDHVTLQAAADWYGIKIYVLTSNRDTCYIEILPHIQKSQRVIFLSFRAEEVHYNSIYPKGELEEHKRSSATKKKWWNKLK